MANPADEKKASILRAMASADRSRWKEPRPPPRVKKPGALPTEWEEQRIVCQWLDAHRIGHFAVPNGLSPSTRGMCSRCVGALKQAWQRLIGSQRAIGFKAGVPDLILTPAQPRAPERRTAIEMKRSKGGKMSDDQKKWKDILERDAYTVIIGRGADDAIRQLRELGYGSG